MEETQTCSSRPDGASTVHGQPFSRLVGDCIPASQPTMTRQHPEERVMTVEMAAELSGWSPEETALQVALSLEGGALQVVSDLRPRERHNWALVQEALQRRFGKRIYAEHAREQLISRQRLDGETPGSYAADILLRTPQGYPDVETVVQEKLALQAFTRGLRPARTYLCPLLWQMVGGLGRGRKSGTHAMHQD
ncbi:hypothetical protein GOODEAATRI_023547 [Goodea atripinnis]|uniref:Retrotransposon gag domain-containing protein n=1 Tax=Goodea atripinnis TaxID=208336 RepID=A0ABV0MUR8_9TELE